MIVHAGGMIRSGSTLQYNIAMQVVSSVPGNRTLHVNECIRNVLYEWMEKPEYVVNKGHFIFYYEPQHARHIKLLLTYRDIRDIIVSTMHFRNASFEEVLSTIYTETIAREKEWLEFIPPEHVHRVRYSDLYQDIAGEVSAIASFLQIPISIIRTLEIASSLSVARIKPILATMNNMHAFMQYSPNHIHSVVPEQWKTKLTSEQVDRIMSDVRIVDWLRENGYAV
jgi:hypothetical protein